MTPAEAKETLQSMIQSKIYQRKYQEALKKQVSDIYDKMQVQQYQTVSDYLTECYENGYIGAMYDIQGQGIPLTLPIDQEAMVTAVQLDSKISQGLYKKLGENIAQLKGRIAANVSRGISSGFTFDQIAQLIAKDNNVGYNNAIRITRTEGHRIQVQSAMNACYDAKDMGADVVKQWDSTLDGNTRKSHREVDGEIRELDEPFSNGLMFPGDPDGGAAEVINCRCGLLERARWALDEDELETLKERAEFWGLDKNDTFEEYKKKYLQATTAEPAQKKTYLTKKKLETLVNDGKTTLADLQAKMKAATGADTYEDFLATFGNLDNAANFGYDKKYIKSLKDQIDATEATLKDYTDKLDKKIIAEQTKKLKKQAMSLQDKLDNYPQKTYSGIWKDDVTTMDWYAKQGSIAAKKQYFEGKLLYATDPADIAKWQGLLDDLDDFNVKGKAYYDIKDELDKANRDLQKLLNGGITKAKSTSGLDYFDQARKDAAKWFKNGFSAADNYFDPPALKIHASASSKERNGFYTYTSGSGGHNRPLAGFEKPWSGGGSGWEERWKKGMKNVWIDFEGKGEQIRGLTTLIQRSTYPDDVWLQSGQHFQTLEGILDIPYGTVQYMTDADLQQFVGRETVIGQFLSTAVNRGGGSMFNRYEMKFNIFAPKGSQMLYASDKGAFGKGENEMILQRGGTYRITKIYWGKDVTDGDKRKLFVDMEIHPEAGYDLFQQDPNEWTGSRKNYRS